MTATTPPSTHAWPHYEATLDCVHCGLCLESCPTYRVLGLETDSPRGRLYLMRALAEDRVTDVASVRHHLDRCLGCRACEPVCPAGVRYGEILEHTRSSLAARGLGSAGARRRRFLLTQVLARPRRLHLAFHLLRAAERFGLRRLAEMLHVVPALTRELLPRVPPARERRPLHGTHEPQGEVRGTVALFTGCVMAELFGDVNRATLALLLANGFRVTVPREQVCCGALLVHDGHRDAAQELARRNVSAFREAHHVVHNSAGCGAAMKEYGHLLGTADGKALATRSRDVLEFLAEQGLRATPAERRARLAYDDPCHLCHGQGVRQAPRQLLGQVPGLTLVHHEDPESCCGSAGIYNMTQPQLAEEIGARKVRDLLASKPDLVATGNPGCMMQIRMHLRRQGAEVPVVHPVELLLPASESAASYR